VRVATAVYRQSSARSLTAYRRPRAASNVTPFLTPGLNSATRALTTPTPCVHASPAPKHVSDSDSPVAAWVEPDSTIAVRFPDGAVSRFHGIWLRDHCRCPSCFHPVTKQRLVDTSTIPLGVKPAVMTVAQDKLLITWDADSHQSAVELDWLRAHSYAPKLPPAAPSAPIRPKRLWDASTAATLPVVQYADVMNSEDGLRTWLSNIDEYGIGFVDGVPPTPEATEALGRRVAFIRETHYGGFWDFSANLAHGDTAYTTLGLPAHTDTTYFTDPVGLQLFHLLEHTGTGGESLYVDGFHVAESLRESHPWAYEVLSTLRLSAHSAGDKDTLIEPATRFPILNHDPESHQLDQVRFNNDDRSAFSHLRPSEVRDFYAALKEWTALLRAPANEFWTRLAPGRAVMVDNWRVLHGRAPFTGHRRLVGCYHSWDDYRSRVKTVLERKRI
jgi:trimethyllysine dioxygenase